MGRLRVLSGREVRRILEQHGFELVRQRGDHMVMQRQVPGSTVTVPVPDHSRAAHRHTPIDRPPVATTAGTLRGVTRSADERAGRPRAKVVALVEFPSGEDERAWRASLPFIERRELREKLPKLTTSSFDALIGELMRLGLIYNWWRDTVASERNDRLTVAPFGQEFLRFVTRARAS